MREWLNREGLNRLPSDLHEALVQVEKLSNNTGETKDPSSVTKTADNLWLFSCVELIGPISPNDWGDDKTSWMTSILNLEGEQYTLFANFEISPSTGATVFSREYNGHPIGWWQRSAGAYSDNQFRLTNAKGAVRDKAAADENRGVLPGFCI